MNKSKLIALVLLVWPTLILAENSDPVDLVRNATDQMLTTLNTSPELRTDPRRLNLLIEDVLLPHVDFDGLSRLTLGKHWQRTSAEQRKGFTREFRVLLIRTYSSLLNNYNNQQIEYLPSGTSKDARRVTVNTRVIETGSPPLIVNYKLRHIDASWKIYDVSIEGVSLAVNYRTTFSQEIESRGIDGLINHLASNNAEGCIAQIGNTADTVQC